MEPVDLENTQALKRKVARLERALREAEEANQAKSLFLSNMSHDIRTPMNAIVGMTSIGLAHIDEKARVQDCLNKIQTASAHLMSLVNDVLDMSRIDSGRMTLAEEGFSLSELVDEVAVMMRPQAAQKGQDFQIRTGDILSDALVGDPLRLRQILVNIIGNAVKYTQEGGEIEAAFSQRPAPDRNGGPAVRLDFSCRDNGMGMSGEFLSRIFLPFERAHGEAMGKIEGTGLGMSIVKKLVDSMGGEITVESEEGRGSRFRVSVPLLVWDSPTGGSQEDSSQDGQALDLSGCRLLLVEDNELNQEIALELLSPTGVQVETADDGAQALDKFRQSPEGWFDLILMDVQMPVMDGYEATRRIRALSRPDAGSVWIVAMTANAFMEDIQLSREAGMNEHISKPVDVDRLMELLRGRLGPRH